MNKHLMMLAALCLGGCGAYPQPFAGNPGRMGARLSLPPPPRLVVVPPSTALLGNADALAFAQDVADALADRSVPAVVGGSMVDWRLTTTAESRGSQVVPTYTVRNPQGVAQGSASGPPVALRTWSAPAPNALKLVATRDAAAISALLDRISAAVQESDPNSLVNRPARIVLKGVTGAPGDGNRALRQQITAQLADLGIVVQDTPQGADYALAGTVRLAPSGTAGQSRVEIQWTVRDPYGKEAGHLLQMNDVPDGTLDRHWGDIAQVIAEEAAGGVREVLVNQTQRRHLASKPKA